MITVDWNELERAELDQGAGSAGRAMLNRVSRGLCGDAGKDRLEATTSTHDKRAQEDGLTRTCLTKEMEEMVPSTERAWSVCACG